ncbi:MAG: ATP-binding protein [Bacteroidota bacterium]|nr:ATP-binding protein [Bacteroidota bacterium]MDP4229035.1 ATP-binding protein [Bacteroidota bacterium]MDP4236219.1 ATP-binding protein [Bacteroidota bacterium]
MNHSVTIEELRKVIALADSPEDLLRWILDRSELREYPDGIIVARTGDQAEYLIIILEGKLDYYADANGKLVYTYSFENDNVTCGISGLIPHSRMKVYGGSTFSVGNLRLLLLHKKYFPALEQLYPEFIQQLIGYMTERARSFATIQLQHEKVSALGKLSAGIAHELNNPASAISRISSELDKRLDLNYELTSKLLSDEVSAGQIERMRALAQSQDSAKQGTLTALQRMEKEDDLADWFTDNGFKDNRQAAETFAEFGYSGHDLENLRAELNKDAFFDLLRWLENILISGRLLKDLADASGRISRLVGAIKSHVHMDRTNDVQRTSLQTDIENTLSLMGYKLRDKNIVVKKNYCQDMPMVEAFVGELNQVWTNLIDNAIDALEKNGELTIETSFDKKNATVRIIDNGAGIPKDIQSRIFDPFFTTKKVGQGTGIGLDIVKRIVNKHHGEIKVHSVPGKTEFVTCIPLSQPQEPK